MLVHDIEADIALSHLGIATSTGIPFEYMDAVYEESRRAQRQWCAEHAGRLNRYDTGLGAIVSESMS